MRSISCLSLVLWWRNGLCLYTPTPLDSHTHTAVNTNTFTYLLTYLLTYSRKYKHLLRHYLTLRWAQVIIVPYRIIWHWCTGHWWVGCYIWYSEKGTWRAVALLCPLLPVPNVTVHPWMASVPITVLLCGFNLSIKALGVNGLFNDPVNIRTNYTSTDASNQLIYNIAGTKLHEEH